MDPQQPQHNPGDKSPRNDGQGASSHESGYGGAPRVPPSSQITQQLLRELRAVSGVEVLAAGSPFPVTQIFGSENQSQWALPFVALDPNTNQQPTLRLGVALEQEAYLLYPLIDGHDVVAALRAMRLIGLLSSVSAASVKCCVESVSPRLPESIRRNAQEQLIMQVSQGGDVNPSRAREQIRQSMLAPLNAIDPLFRQLHEAQFPMRRQDLYLAVRQGMVTNSPEVSKAAYACVDGLAGTRAPLPAYSGVWQRAEESFVQRLLGGLTRTIRGTPDPVTKESIDAVVNAFQRFNCPALVEQGLQTLLLGQALESDPTMSRVLSKNLGMQQHKDLSKGCVVLALSMMEFSEYSPLPQTRGELFASIRRLGVLQERFARLEKAFALIAQEAISDPDSSDAADAVALNLLFKSHIAEFNAQLRHSFNGILEEVPARLATKFALIDLRPCIE